MSAPTPDIGKPISANVLKIEGRQKTLQEMHADPVWIMKRIQTLMASNLSKENILEAVRETVECGLSVATGTPWPTRKCAYCSAPVPIGTLCMPCAVNGLYP